MEINHNGKHVLVVCPNPSIDIFAWVHNFRMGQPNRIVQEERYPGGKGIHVAMALAEAGISVTVAGFWGSLLGEWIKKECNKYYPQINFVGPTLREWSRSCYTFKESDSNQEFDDTEVLGMGPLVNEQEVNHLYNSIENLLPQSKAVVLSGSWPQGSPENGYQTILKTVNSYNIPSFLDCTGIQLENALNERPYCIHLNRKEITSHFQTQNFEIAKEKLLNYCEIAAVTDGSKGLYLYNNTQSVHSLAKVDQVISTIGSGDCLLAGIVAGHLQNFDYIGIAKLGAAFGAANCIRKELGMLYKKDVEELFEKADFKILQ